MYLDFYALTQTPFHITPDPAFFYMGPSHQLALGAITYSVQERQGFVAIFGEVGVGKTTVLRAYMERLPLHEHTVIDVRNPHLTFHALLQLMARACGVDGPLDDPDSLLLRLQQACREAADQGRPVVLLLDEAQAMPLETLEQLPLLSPAESTSEPLVHIVLCGQPELQQRLHEAPLRQLAQRVIIRATILPLTKRESQAYIQHRLAKARQQDGPVFTPGAIRTLVRHAQGVPRLLNVLCTNALVAGFATQQRPIQAATVRRVIADVVGRCPRPVWPRGALALASAAAVSGLLWWASWQRVPPSVLPLVPSAEQEQVRLPVDGLAVDGRADAPQASVALPDVPGPPPQLAAPLTPQEVVTVPVPVPVVPTGVPKPPRQPGVAAERPQGATRPERKRQAAGGVEKTPRPRPTRVAAVPPRTRADTPNRLSTDRLDSQAMRVLLTKLETTRRPAVRMTPLVRSEPPAWLPPSDSQRLSVSGPGTALSFSFVTSSGHDSTP